MLAEISAGYTSLKAAIGIVQGLSEANTQVQINAVKIELQRLILEAQQALMAAQHAQATSAGQIAELQQEIARLNDWSAEKARYQIQDVWRGSMAYTLRPGMENGDAAHWLCTDCFEKGRKSFLQFKGQDRTPNGSRGPEATYGCNTCKATIKTSYRSQPGGAGE